MKEQDKTERLLNLLIQANKTIRHNRPLTDLALNEMIVLNILNYKEKQGKETQMKDLSERMNSSRPALNALINKVEEKELVERFQKPGDRKSVYVRLTKKSHLIYDSQNKMMHAYMKDIIAQMGEHDSDKLVELLEKLLRIINTKDSS